MLVSVITLTRDRNQELLAAIESVARQDYHGDIEHIIVGDRSGPLHAMERTILRKYPRVRVLHIDMQRYAGQFIDCYSPSRVGFIRNWAIERANGEYIAQLDDDNLYDPDHVSSLAGVLDSHPMAGIAYSWRRLEQSDGTPYVDPEYPWTPMARLAQSKGALSHFIYDELVGCGIRIPGSNVVRDCVVTRDGRKVYTVDTSELMVRKDVHNRFRFVVDFFWREMVGDYSDDYAFVKKCHEAGIGFTCSEQVTLTYRLGGLSNGH